MLLCGACLGSVIPSLADEGLSRYHIIKNSHIRADGKIAPQSRPSHYLTGQHVQVCEGWPRDGPVSTNIYWHSGGPAACLELIESHAQAGTPYLLVLLLYCRDPVKYSPLL